MTTTVKIEAHLSNDKEVLVSVNNMITGEAIEPPFTLQDGETAERYVYDDRTVAVIERSK